MMSNVKAIMFQVPHLEILNMWSQFYHCRVYSSVLPLAPFLLMSVKEHVIIVQRLLVAILVLPYNDFIELILSVTDCIIIPILLPCHNSVALVTELHWIHVFFIECDSRHHCSVKSLGIASCRVCNLSLALLWYGAPQKFCTVAVDSFCVLPF